MLTNTPIVTINQTSLSYSVKSDSVDQSLKDMKQHPNVIEFLKTSNLGFEYVSVNVNHGDQLYFTLNK